MKGYYNRLVSAIVTAAVLFGMLSIHVLANMR